MTQAVEKVIIDATVKAQQQETVKKMNIYQKFLELKKRVGGFERDSTGFGYKYVSGSQVLDNVRDLAHELGILIMPSTEFTITEHEEVIRTNKKNEQSLAHVVKGYSFYEIINVHNPDEKITFRYNFIGEQGDPSMAIGSAWTYLERYVYLKMLGLPTDEIDPDNPNNKKIETAKDTVATIKKTTRKGTPKAVGEAPTQPTITPDEIQPQNMTKAFSLIKGTKYNIQHLMNSVKKNYGGKTINELTDKEWLEVEAKFKKAIEEDKKKEVESDLPFPEQPDSNPFDVDAKARELYEKVVPDLISRKKL